MGDIYKDIIKKEASDEAATKRVPPAPPSRQPEPPARRQLDMGPPPKPESEPIKEHQSPGPATGPGDTPMIGSGTGEVHVPISEVSYLEFRITKLEDENIKLQEAKISSDETVLRMSRVNLTMMKEAFAKRTLDTYNKIGIGDGDQVVQKGAGFFIIKKVKGSGVSPSGVRR